MYTDNFLYTVFLLFVDDEESTLPGSESVHVMRTYIGNTQIV